MSDPLSKVSTTTSSTTPTTRGAPKPPGASRSKLLGEQLHLAQVDLEARRKAAAVLEVLAGLRSADQAARSLDVSLLTYFNLETRALRGLLFACTPHPPGRRQATDKKLRDAEARIEELSRQVQRHQALLRVAQSGLGLTSPTTTSAKDVAATSTGKRRRHQPAVRATRVIRLLQQQQGQPGIGGDASTVTAPTTATGAPGSAFTSGT